VTTRTLRRAAAVAYIIALVAAITSDPRGQP
jgi:hypothetical protein